MNLEEDDVVLCTVKRIEGTTVFLDIEGNGAGTMIFSEVSPGRIRNIREFVVPGKKIVCKVLRIKGDHVELSLRRVIARERDNVMNLYKKEKVLKSMIKTVVKEKAEESIEKIKEKYGIDEFIESVRNNPEILEKIFSKNDAEQLKKIFSEKKEKEKEIRKKIIVNSSLDSGIIQIKEVLNEGETDKSEIRYDGSSQFSIYVYSPDFKSGNKAMDELIKKMAEKAKKLNVKIEVKEK